MALDANTLSPPSTKGNTSVAKLAGYWYIACPGKELKQKPIARQVLGIPMVLFRDAGGLAHALLDRCPHRNVPLSMGRVQGSCLECKYHGWQFAGDGACKRIPGLLDDDHDAKGRRATAYPTREQEGFVWVWPSEAEPVGEPFRFPLLDTPGYMTVRRSVSAPGSLHAVVENALDVPHTAFLHAGLFRGSGEPNPIDVVVRRQADRVEAEYLGEPRPSGLAGRILSPSGGVVTHFDRFLLPSIIQVEYSIGTENHILVCAVATPVRDFFTVLHAVISFRFRIPNWLVRPFLTPIAMRIFKQDVAVLKLQTETVEAFGGEQYTSTEIDVLGRDIWRLLRMAERDELSENGELVERRLSMRA